MPPMPPTPSSDPDAWPCPDCGVAVGVVHLPGCDVARCPRCGGQEIGCDCPEPGPGAAVPPRPAWTGLWPDVVECREHGIYAKLVPGRGWVACGPDDPDGSEDLNRLYSPEFRWDAAAGRFVRARPAPGGG